MSELTDTDTENPIENAEIQTVADHRDAPELPAEDAEQANAAFDFGQEPAAAMSEAATEEPAEEHAAASAPRQIETQTEDDVIESAPAEPEEPVSQASASEESASEPAPKSEQESAESELPIPVEALTQALDAALENPKQEAYRDFIEAYEDDSGHGIDAIAAALAVALADAMHNARRRKPHPQRRDQKNHSGSERRLPEEGMAQYRIDVGRSDGVQPRNIVGALTNEAELGAGDIGYIKIFDRFSLVELPEDIPQDELDHLGDVWVCGRKMGIRLDDGPPENDGGKPHPPRRDKRPQQGRGGPRDGHRGGARQQYGGQGNRRNRSQGDDARQGGGELRQKPQDDDFGNRIDYTPKDRGRLHNIIYGDGIANVGQDNGPGGAPSGPGKGRRNGGGFKGKRSGGFAGRGNGGPPRGRRRQD